MLDTEFKYFTVNQDELVAGHNGKFIAIVGTKVMGAFDTELEAYLATNKDHEVGTFLIQHCLPGTLSYTQTFHSRVVF